MFGYENNYLSSCLCWSTPLISIIYILCWTCSHLEYSWNTAYLTLNTSMYNNNDINLHFQKCSAMGDRRWAILWYSNLSVVLTFSIFWSNFLHIKLKINYQKIYMYMFAYKNKTSISLSWQIIELLFLLMTAILDREGGRTVENKFCKGTSRDQSVV